MRDGKNIISRENVFRGKRREKSDSKTRQIVASVISSRNMYTQASFFHRSPHYICLHAFACIAPTVYTWKAKGKNLYITQLVPLSHTYPGSHCVTREWNKKQIFLLAPLLACFFFTSCYASDSDCLSTLYSFPKPEMLFLWNPTFPSLLGFLHSWLDPRQPEADFLELDIMWAGRREIDSSEFDKQATFACRDAKALN